MQTEPGQDIRYGYLALCRSNLRLTSMQRPLNFRSSKIESVSARLNGLRVFLLELGAVANV